MRTLLKDTYTDLYYVDKDSKTQKEVFAKISQYIQHELSLKVKSIYNILMTSDQYIIHDGVLIIEICLSNLKRPYAFILCKMLNPINFWIPNAGPINAILIHLNCDQTNLKQLRPMSNLAAIIKDDQFREMLSRVKSDDDIVLLFRLFTFDKVEKRQMAS